MGVRYQEGVVRGRVEAVCGDMASVFLCDWGVSVQRHFLELLRIPDTLTLSQPRSELAQRLRLGEEGKVSTGTLLQELVTECRRGTLSSRDSHRRTVRHSISAVLSTVCASAAAK